MTLKRTKSFSLVNLKPFGWFFSSFFCLDTKWSKGQGCIYSFLLGGKIIFARKPATFWAIFSFSTLSWHKVEQRSRLYLFLFALGAKLFPLVNLRPFGWFPAELFISARGLLHKNNRINKAVGLRLWKGKFRWIAPTEQAWIPMKNDNVIHNCRLKGQNYFRL